MTGLIAHCWVPRPFVGMSRSGAGITSPHSVSLLFYSASSCVRVLWLRGVCLTRAGSSAFRCPLTISLPYTNHLLVILLSTGAARG